MCLIEKKMNASFSRDVSDYLSYEHRVFNTDEFLKTREPEDQPFYKKVTFQLIIYLVFNLQKSNQTIQLMDFSSWQVLETHIFHSFLKERLNGKMDTFTRMEGSIRKDDQK